MAPTCLESHRVIPTLCAQGTFYYICKNRVARTGEVIETTEGVGCDWGLSAQRLLLNTVMIVNGPLGEPFSQASLAPVHR